MKLIQSLMGRRQFLMTAGATSALGLGYNKLAGVHNMGIKADMAMASEKPDTSDIKGVFSHRYSHLLSPLKIGDVVLKNRMFQTDSFPRFLQGPERFPAATIIDWYANVAKNGCAIPMLFRWQDPGPDDETPPDRLPAGDWEFMPLWDRNDRRAWNYYAQMVEAIHFHGSKAAVGIGGRSDSSEGYSIGGVVPQWRQDVRELTETSLPQIPIENIQRMIDAYVEDAKFYHALDVDMVNIHMSYLHGITAHALSPIYNKRTDKYGGSLENRARLALELFQAIKKACGPNLLVGAHLSGEELVEGGYTTKDIGEYAKVWEGALDILTIRGRDQDEAHPNAFTFQKGDNPIIRYARAVKETGTKMVIAVNGGFQDLDENEKLIASGTVDLIGMARTWYADPEYGKKAYEGRGEDVVPCVMCNECHYAKGAPVTYCSVNPEVSVWHRRDIVDAPTISRKVAVIGGGPAGMKAAIIAAERGHKVALYEKLDYLGGQLRHVDYVSFKWGYKEFKDYLIRQVYKAGIEVHLMTTATPEMIKSRDFDVVLAAVGADPVIPDIPGAKGANVRAPIFVYGAEKSLSKNVVIIGADQIGTEAGIHLAQKGHQVTILTKEKKLAREANWIYLGPERWMDLEKEGKFGYITEVSVTGISEKKVTYIDAKGNEKFIPADSVVISAGRQPRTEEALKFYGSAERFFLIGDCNYEGDGNVRKTQRSAFSAASKI